MSSWAKMDLLDRALLIGGLANLERRPIVAGILFGILTNPSRNSDCCCPCAVADRSLAHYRGGRVTAAVLVALTTLWFGADIWTEYLQKVVAAAALVADHRRQQRAGRSYRRPSSMRGSLAFGRLGLGRADGSRSCCALAAVVGPSGVGAIRCVASAVRHCDLSVLTLDAQLRHGRVRLVIALCAHARTRLRRSRAVAGGLDASHSDVSLRLSHLPIALVCCRSSRRASCGGWPTASAVTWKLRPRSPRRSVEHRPLTAPSLSLANFYRAFTTIGTLYGHGYVPPSASA